MQALRIFVNFEADFPTRGQPAGRELAEFIHTVLATAGFDVAAPEPREDWAWTIRSEQTLREVEIVVGRMASTAATWLVTLDAHVSLAFGLVAGEEAEDVREETLRPFCEALDSALIQDSRFRQVRWFTPEEYDSGGGVSGRQDS